MLTHISKVETSKHFSSMHPPGRLNRASVRLISPRQKQVLFIEETHYRGADNHSRSLFKKSLEELDRVEASDMMRYFNRNIIPEGS